MDACDYENDILVKADITHNISKKIDILKNKIFDISNRKAEKLCIFGAGEYGMKLYQELSYRLIKPNYFSDNNPKKWGYVIENTYCLSPERLDKENTLLIVAIKNPELLVCELKEKGFFYVTTKNKIDHLMKDVPPVLWVEAARKYKKIDYSSKNIIEIIEKFNQTLFEICQFYEKG